MKQTRPVGRALSALVDELAYNAKLNKPDDRWTTGEWDKLVDIVAAAMKTQRQSVIDG